MRPAHRQSSAQLPRGTTASPGSAITAQLPRPPARRTRCSPSEHSGEERGRARHGPGTCRGSAQARAADTGQTCPGHRSSRGCARRGLGWIHHHGISPMGLCWLLQLSWPLPLAMAPSQGGLERWCWAAPSRHLDQDKPRCAGSSPSPTLTLKLRVVSIVSCFRTHFSLK